MLKFQATVVEAFLGEFDIFTVHFDDQADQYLQLRAPEEPEDPREIEEGYGCVEVEMNDQLYSGYNCFSAAELSRSQFRIVLAGMRGSSSSSAKSSLNLRSTMPHSPNCEAGCNAFSDNSLVCKFATNESRHGPRRAFDPRRDRNLR